MEDSVTPLQRSHVLASRVAMGMAASIPIYILIVEFFLKSTSEMKPILSPDYHNLARNIVFVIAVLCVLMARLVKSMLLLKATGKSMLNREDAARQLRSRLMLAFLVSYGLAELPSILGLGVFLLTGQSQSFYLLILVSVYLFAVHAPRYAQWQSWFTHRMRSFGNMHGRSPDSWE